MGPKARFFAALREDLHRKAAFEIGCLLEFPEIDRSAATRASWRGVIFLLERGQLR
jgi:hypothetical protein